MAQRVDAADLVVGEAAKKVHAKGMLMAVNAGVHGRAAHMSSFSTAFSLMQAAMMMLEATPRPLRERSIDSTGVVPLSSSIDSA